MLSWRGLVDTMTLPRVGLLVVVGSLVVLAFAALEGTFSLFLRERLHWEPETRGVRLRLPRVWSAPSSRGA